MARPEMNRRIVACVGCAMVLFAAIGAPGSSAQDASGRAGIIVSSEGREVARMCIALDAGETTGADLLDRSGLEVAAEAKGMGTAVCSIEGTGCGTDDCFCRYPTFWGYWVRDRGDDAWRFSDAGASDRIVEDGSLDAWSWGRDGKPAPSDVAFSDVCSSAAAASTPASAPSAASDAPDYLAFAGFVALLASAAAIAYAVRRRRTGR